VFDEVAVEVWIDFADRAVDVDLDASVLSLDKADAGQDQAEAQ